MKAPDKIYVIPDFVDGLSLERKDFDDEVCYIRKDALLEWAKEHQERERQGSYTWSCYQIFIDKLNEM